MIIEKETLVKYEEKITQTCIKVWRYTTEKNTLQNLKILEVLKKAFYDN